uniref:Expansin-like EG45 domain-containing protein n=1 Tax=Oryza punctata TaxID=4537 RepID=A0A0E0KT45_ORYPU
MAASSRFSAPFSLCVLLLLLLAPPISASFLFDGGKSKSSAAAVDMEWRPATATWYGDAEGDGSTVTRASTDTAGGACGYGSLVDVVPMKARVGSVSPVLFKDGEGCGACYKVKCLDHDICSRRAVTVIVTDECPGGLCAFGRTHFDLSGAAFSRMAVAGAGGHLRDRGQLSVVYRRTACKYGGKNIAFRVNEGSTNFWLSLLVEFEDGQGDIGSMQIKQANSVEWLDMKHVWGATWCLVRGPLVGPFSVRLTTLSAQKALTARDVIPRNWKPTATYTSRLNFEAAL